MSLCMRRLDVARATHTTTTTRRQVRLRPHFDHAHYKARACGYPEHRMTVLVDRGRAGIFLGRGRGAGSGFSFSKPHLRSANWNGMRGKGDGVYLLKEHELEVFVLEDLVETEVESSEDGGALIRKRDGVRLNVLELEPLERLEGNKGEGLRLNKWAVVEGLLNLERALIPKGVDPLSSVHPGHGTWEQDWRAGPARRTSIFFSCSGWPDSNLGYREGNLPSM
ncbi:hypothetical protein GGX14DRAFT_397325 [Mycena pura]|uniref:Uncharacterized protein n=1 Tax=Mycena pura TaxID=153505 RepID=A0AAD6V8U5_9AGAR|nr:hypothetical protein GGX14DRAFT_397325 [Mycena pura]